MKSPLILLFARNGDFAQSVRFLTALVTKAEARSGLQIQGHPFLAKPISIPELVAGIERNLPALSHDGHVASFGVANVTNN
jgi:DNA-binding response OmpR family regulator